MFGLHGRTDRLVRCRESACVGAAAGGGIHGCNFPCSFRGAVRGLTRVFLREQQQAVVSGNEQQQGMRVAAD